MLVHCAQRQQGAWLFWVEPCCILWEFKRQMTPVQFSWPTGAQHKNRLRTQFSRMGERPCRIRPTTCLLKAQTLGMSKNYLKLKSYKWHNAVYNKIYKDKCRHSYCMQKVLIRYCNQPNPVIVKQWRYELYNKKSDTSRAKLTAKQFISKIRNYVVCFWDFLTYYSLENFWVPWVHFKSFLMS